MKKVSRRAFLATGIAGGVAVGAGAPLLMKRAHKRKTGRIMISGWGGAMQRAMRTAYFDPFTRKTGIEVVEQSWGGQGLAQLKAQLMEGGAQVDLLDGPPFWASIGRRGGLLDRIDLPDVDRAQFVQGSINEYAFGYSTASWGLVYMRSGKRAPRSWSDFWDARKFEGRRAMYGRWVARHPEYALLADGVAPTEVYPLTDASVDRAFVKLEQIKPSIHVWYQTAAVCEQLLMGNQIEMAEYMNGRAFFLQDQGVPLEYVWENAISNTPVFVLAKDAPNRDNAMHFLDWIAQPEPQARFAELIYYGPTNLRALEQIKNPKTLERLPSYGPNAERQIPLDVEWWAQNLERLSPRWARFIAR